MYSTQAIKSYAKLPECLRQQINAKMLLLAENPYAKNNNIKTIHGRKGCFRLRVGDWRIVYELVKRELIIHVIRIAQRKEVYR